MAHERPILTNREILSDTHKKVTQLFNAMYGDKDASIKGIAHRVKDLESKEKKQSLIYTLISSISAGIALAVQAIINHLK